MKCASECMVSMCIESVRFQLLTVGYCANFGMFITVVSVHVVSSAIWRINFNF